MVKWRVKDPQGFIEKLVRGLHDASDEIFNLSQVYVPVDEGTLKESGVNEKHGQGFIIRYRTSYAARQEFGLDPGYTEEVKRHSVKRYVTPGYSRTSKLGKVIVMPPVEHPAHDRGPFTRVFKSGYAGRFYLTKAWDEIRPRLLEFITRLYQRSK